jgi:hypothetical protein
MNKSFDLRALLPAIFFLIVSLYACTKPENTIGIEVQPEGDILNATQLLVPVHTSTIGPRQIASDEPPANLAGIFNDPIFGISSASFSTQFRLSAAWDTISPADLLLDSIVLSLKYASVYRNASTTLTPISLSVYELSKNVFFDSTYFTNSTIETFPAKIGEKTGILPVVADSVLKIRLDDAFGQKIINASGTANLRNNTDFFKFFKGLQIKPEYTPGLNEGSIVSFVRTATTISVYYKKRGVVTESKFFVTTSDGNFNHFNFDYNSSSVESALALSQNSTLSYLQGMGGVNAAVKIPNIKNLLPSGDVVINKATLIIPIESTTPGLLPPSQIFAVQYDSARGTTLPIPDILIGDGYFGGSYNATGNEYRINIGRFIHANLSSNSLNPLYLFPASPASTPNRVVFRGGAASEKPMRLEIIYTKP